MKDYAFLLILWAKGLVYNIIDNKGKNNEKKSFI